MNATETLMLDVEVPAGDGYAGVIPAGGSLRIVDLHGNQAVDTLFYNAHDYADRYSAQDTIWHQKNIYLTTGSKLISTRGTPKAPRRSRSRAMISWPAIATIRK